MVQVVIAVWLVIGLCLLSGFRTRLMSLLNFVIVLSIFQRNPLLESGADVILRLLSFWIIFIPLNHYYSLDALLLRRKNPDWRAPQSTYAFPVRMIQVQIALIYLGAGISKLLGDTWWNGTALFYVLQLDSFILPPGRWLASNGPDWLLYLLTYGVVIIELSFPILVFVPSGQPTLRRLALVLVTLMHLGIAITMTMPLVEFLLVLGASYFVFFAQEVGTEAHYPKQRIILNIGLSAVMALIIWTNTDNFRRLQAPIVPVMPNSALSILNVLGLNQGWDLFAPNPIRIDWSVAVVGVLADDSLYNLRTGQPFEEKVLPSDSLVSFRWKRLEQFMGTERSIPVLESVSAFYCRTNNPPSALPKMVQLRFIYRPSHAPGEPVWPIRSDLIWMRVCEA
jgi:hypothetical protein